MSKVIRSNDELNALANGKNLVTNGTNLETTSGWLEADTNTTISNDASRLKVLNTGTTYGYGKNIDAVPTIIGSTYELSLDMIDGNVSSYRIGVGIAQGSLSIVSNGYTEAGSIKLNFIATSTTTYIRVGMDTNVATSYVYFDNISVKEIPQVQGENLPDYVANRINFGFKNYMINGGFDVWQRGTSKIVSGLTYLSDRWYGWESIGSGTVSQVPGYLHDFAQKVTPVATAFCLHAQRIEGAMSHHLYGKEVTLSFICKSDNASDISINLINANSRDNFSTTTSFFSAKVGDATAGDILKFTYTFTNSQNLNGLQIEIIANSSTGFTLYECQLEEGSVATPFEQRPYGLELSLCQRYYFKGFGFSHVPKRGDFTEKDIKFPSTMRVTPTIVLYGDEVAGTLFQNDGAGSPRTQPFTIGANENCITAIYSTGAVSLVGSHYTGRFTADAEL